MNNELTNTTHTKKETQLILAPMATLSHEALRRAIFRFGGCDEYYCEMIHASSLIAGGQFEKYYISQGPEPEKMVWQLTDTSAEPLIKAASIVAPLGGIGEELAGYKGYGYATVVEVLSAALQQGQFLSALSGIGANGEKVPYHLGHFFIAIDTEAFAGREEFKKTAGDIMRALRNSKKAPGQERIYTAGEKEWDVWCERKDKGVPINEAVQKEMSSVRDSLGLDYKFPWD